MTTPLTNPTLPFKTPQAWENWLKKNHDRCDGIWLQMYKKDTQKPSINYPQALDVALCYGWIDGQKKSYDAESWIQRFTPRRPKSNWSKVNQGHVERLIHEKRMQPAGLAQIEAAKKDGRWDQAYDSQKNMSFPEDFLEALKKNKKAQQFFDSLNSANRYAIAYRLQTAKKSETRERRMQMILEMLKEGKSFHPF